MELCPYIVVACLHLGILNYQATMLKLSGMRREEEDGASIGNVAELHTH